ncbi:hypothetical protein BJX64DRAFT_291282 [Aspergillus heterothallicus]
MKLYQSLIVLLGVNIAHAQLIDLPQCSVQCILNAMSHDGCSSLADFVCHCRQPSLVTEVTPCVQQACNVQDQSSVSNAVTAQCSSVGVPISIPPVTGSTSHSHPATSDGTATETTAQTTETESPPVPSGPLMTLPTTTPTTTPSSTPIGSSSSVPSASSPSGPSDSTPSPPVFDGGAGTLRSGGSLVGAAAAVVAGYLL